MRLKHKAPGGWTIHGFNRWVCGRKDFSWDLSVTSWVEVTCPDCLKQLHLSQHHDAPT